jgi:predicted nucleic acid-binding protein
MPGRVPAGGRKYTLDTNLFIRAFRDAEAQAALLRFHAAFAPFEYLSVVVAQELRAGTPRLADRRHLERDLLAVFERSGRIITPSRRVWHQSGDVLAALAGTEGVEPGRVSKAFGNDVLLGLSCREAGITLVTDNLADFARISRIVPVPFAAPWPGAT